MVKGSGVFFSSGAFFIAGKNYFKDLLLPSITVTAMVFEGFGGFIMSN